MDSLPEGYRNIYVVTTWGTSADLAAPQLNKYGRLTPRSVLDEMIDDLQESREIAAIKHGLFAVLARVARVDDSGSDGSNGPTPPILSLDIAWGVDGQVIYQLPPEGGAPVTTSPPHTS